MILNLTTVEDPVDPGLVSAFYSLSSENNLAVRSVCLLKNKIPAINGIHRPSHISLVSVLLAEAQDELSLPLRNTQTAELGDDWLPAFMWKPNWSDSGENTFCAAV